MPSTASWTRRRAPRRLRARPSLAYSISEHGGSTVDTMPLKVVVAEDSYLVREVLTQILRDDPELELAAVAEDATGLESAIEDELPDVVLTDIFMPPSQGAEGIHVAARLRESHPEIGVVILSQYRKPASPLGLLYSVSPG